MVICIFCCPADFAVVGMMLDFAIRHATDNRKSLDDVMRSLYNKYYRKKKRGFTEDEFRRECEQTAGSPLAEVFEYVSTTKELNYKKYFGFAGLDVDTTKQELPVAGRAFRRKSRETPSCLHPSTGSHLPGRQASVQGISFRRQMGKMLIFKTLKA